jgi:hypothetical protein
MNLVMLTSEHQQSKQEIESTKAIKKCRQGKQERESTKIIEKYYNCDNVNKSKIHKLMSFGKYFLIQLQKTQIDHQRHPKRENLRVEGGNLTCQECYHHLTCPEQKKDHSIQRCEKLSLVEALVAWTTRQRC